MYKRQDLNDTLTIQVSGLPILGMVTLANGDAVSDGQVLSVSELTGLQYDAPIDYDGTSDPGDFTYTVTDGTTTVTGSTDITILEINDTPFNVGQIPDQVNLDADTIIGLDISTHFDDIEDSGNLTFNISGLPTGLTFDATSGVISGDIDNSCLLYTSPSPRD